VRKRGLKEKGVSLSLAKILPSEGKDLGPFKSGVDCDRLLRGRFAAKK